MAVLLTGMRLQGMTEEEKNNADSSGADDQPPAKKSGRERNSAAKAFFRAMYAGAEPDPEEFGLQTQQEDSGSSRENCAFCERMQVDLEAMEQKAKDAEDHYKRLAADFDNFRKRTERERKEFSGHGTQSAIEALLPALDDMNRAKDTLSAEMDSASILDSLNVVINRFSRCLEQLGIKQLEVIGEQFDPVYHEPVQQIPTTEHPDGAVVHELRAGYMFGEKVLRPALVNVATNDGPVIPKEPAKEPEKVEDAKEETVEEKSPPSEKAEEAEAAVPADEQTTEETASKEEAAESDSTESAKQESESKETKKSADEVNTSTGLNSLIDRAKATSDLPAIDINEALHVKPADDEEQTEE